MGYGQNFAGYSYKNDFDVCKQCLPFLFSDVIVNIESLE